MDKLYKLLVIFVGLVVMNSTVQSQSIIYPPDFSPGEKLENYPLTKAIAGSSTASAKKGWSAFSFFPKAKQAIDFNNYPNPATTFTTVSYNLTKKTPVLLRVIDLAGKQLAVLVKQEQSGKQEFYWDFAKNNITSGMYILLLQVDNRTYSRKFIVQ